MADFNYLVVDGKGKEKKGTIEAQDSDDARVKLRSQGLTVVSVSKASALNKDLSFGEKKVTPRDLSVFCRQFISMVNAGVTILDAMDMVKDQTENKTLKKALNGVYTNIQKGEPLSDSLTKYPKVFPNIMISMVAAGEASGKLDVAFERLAEHFEKSSRLNAMIKKAMMYPIIVGLVAVAVIVVMLVQVIPSYSSMFDEMGGELPAITQAFLDASNFLQSNWLILIIVIAAIVFGVRAFRKTVTGQIFFGTISRKLPVFGDMTIKNAASNYARTLSTLIYSGLPMIDALAITANTMSNYLYKQDLKKARDQVATGVLLSECIEASGLYPPMVGHMTHIGEETGDLEGMLNRLADYYDEEVEMATQSLTAAMEPMIILVLAGIVCLLVAAIMSPMMSLYSQMDSL